MGVLRNSTGEAPRNVQAWMNGHSDNSSRPLMTKSTNCCSICRDYLGEESSNVQRCSCCGRTLCEKCEEGQYGSAECCCGYANGFEEENHENDGPSSLSSERMDESTGPVQSGSAEAKIEQLVSNQQFASNRSLHYSFSSPRSGYEYDNDSERNFFTPSSSFSLATTSDTDSISMTTSRSTSGFSTLKSFPPTPLEIPSKALENSDETTPTSRRRPSPSALSDEEPTQDYEIAPTSINLDTNSLIWLPPVAADEDADTETNIYEFDEDEDTNGFFVNSGSDEDEFGGKTSSLTSQKEALRSELGGHFKVLVAQLLEGESVSDTWLEIVSGLAWEAANFVKPDTSKGDSMDPGKYVKVKCIASGSQNDCTFVKGVVCSKNVKHKRMVAQHTNPRLVLIGGALDYEKKLASFDTTFERENDHLKNIVSQIKAQKPNVLLVEKSVSPYAQEILSQDISLVLNVKKKLLETIARCVGAQIASCRETIGSSHVGRCLVFRTEKVTTECVSSDNSIKKVVKTLMFFEGCPKRLGCTVLLRGASLEELKKVKRVIQFAAFAAYHLSLETSFLADERAFLPKTPKVVLFPNGSNSLANGLSASEDFSEESAPAGEIALEEVNKQSILVYLSTTCSLKGSGTVCDQSKLFKIKFYGSNDKPLGRFLHDDLFTQAPYCGSCNEPTENHVLCYSHQQGSLTISMKRLMSSSVRLPGQRDGKIWMWHRCLRCKPVNGIPPATTRVLMSSSAWGLSFGKFLELGFSNHTTANRVANCGHSLQRDCLRFYGCGNMVAVFRYSPVDILAVNLPPSVMDFTNRVPVKWVKDQISEIYTKADCLHAEVSHVLNTIKSNVLSSNDETLILRVHEMVVGFRDKIQLEKNEYKTLLELVASESAQPPIDVLELNQWRRGLINNASKWDHSLFNLDSYSKGNNNSAASDPSLLEASSRRLDENASPKLTECNSNSIVEMDLSIEGLSMVSGQFNRQEEDESSIEASSESISPSSILSEQIFLHWTGSTDQLPFQSDLFGPVTRKALAPVRVHSFESALIPTSMAKETLPNIRRAYSQRTPKIDDVASPQIKSNYRILNASFTMLSDGARVPQLVHTNTHDIFIDIYDEELTSIVASAMTSQEYNSFVSSESQEHNHFRVSFDDGGSFHMGDKGRYSVTCYFAKQFDSLRKACCPSEIDFVRSISRCKKWSAHGGKSNAYFAKTLDERFIVKQVTRTELDSFEDFGSGYFKHMTESLTTCSPTSLAKVVGLFQVVAKNLKGGKEMKMDFMVMENLFFGRNISRIYDLKGSLRSRYNHDSEGDNKVLLDLNLLETLHTKPIFLGSKSKLYLERAVWNDTSFLAAGDVMDYSLLVGIDEEKKELVIGIIDYLRQYTWDKQLETWVKASGILGGPKNTPPTVISPDQYKKRFRKAMSRYFLTLHNQLSS